MISPRKVIKPPSPQFSPPAAVPAPTTRAVPKVSTPLATPSRPPRPMAGSTATTPGGPWKS